MENFRIGVSLKVGILEEKNFATTYGAKSSNSSLFPCLKMRPNALKTPIR